MKKTHIGCIYIQEWIFQSIKQLFFRIFVFESIFFNENLLNDEIFHGKFHLWTQVWTFLVMLWKILDYIIWWLTQWIEIPPHSVHMHLCYRRVSKFSEMCNCAPNMWTFFSEEGISLSEVKNYASVTKKLERNTLKGFIRSVVEPFLSMMK